MQALREEMQNVRHELHRRPEIGYFEKGTSRLIAERLRAWGLEVTDGVAGTGIVAALRGNIGGGARSVALRADMDALYLREESGHEYASKHDGLMHACGHDGHMAMLLGAAHYLAGHRDFQGTAYFIFQPAEEGLGGANKMMSEGLFARFPADAIYGMHNWPGLPAGEFHTRVGPLMAACQLWTVSFHGNGGHAGAGSGASFGPNLPLTHFILALESLVHDRDASGSSAVVSVGPIQAGDIGSANVIPSHVTVRGTIRSFDEGVLDELVRSMTAAAEAKADEFSCTTKVEFHPRTPVLANHAAQTTIAATAAAAIVGTDHVNTAAQPSMAGEDFAEFLKVLPGAFVFIGADKPLERNHPALHTETYDFNDEILELGAAYWVQLVRMELSSL